MEIERARQAQMEEEESKVPRNRRARRYKDTGSNAGDKQSQKSYKSRDSRVSGSPMKSSLKFAQNVKWNK